MLGDLQKTAFEGVVEGVGLHRGTGMLSARHLKKKRTLA